jgi:DNA-binding NarL/FixJ family response regulator
MKNIWISIVEDHQMFAQAMDAVLGGTPGMQVLFTAKDGKDFFEKLEASPRFPDVIIMDVEMQGMDGITTSKRLLKKYPDSKIIIVTSHRDESYIYSLMEIGVKGYLFKLTDLDEVIKAVEAVYNGETHYNQAAISVLSKNMKASRKNKLGIMNMNIGLSPRELQVLSLICEGDRTQNISEKLHIGKRTVETHRKNLIRKTGVKNTPDLVVYAIKNRLVNI